MAIDGRTRRTFAYACGDRKIGDASYIDPVKQGFVAARGVNFEMPQLNQVDLLRVGCVTINGQSGDELVALVKKAMDKHALLVFLFHGVGGGHALNVSLGGHSQLLHFLKQHEEAISIAPMIDVAEYVRNAQDKTALH